MDDVRRQLHNEAVMEQMKDIERDVGGVIDDARIGAEKEDPSQDSHSAEGPTGDQAVEPSGPVMPSPPPDDSSRKVRDGG